jgi:hypothetical protein
MSTIAGRIIETVSGYVGFSHAQIVFQSGQRCVPRPLSPGQEPISLIKLRC